MYRMETEIEIIELLLRLEAYNQGLLPLTVGSDQKLTFKQRRLLRKIRRLAITEYDKARMIETIYNWFCGE